ncbi:MAG: TRAP transporter small permease [Pseudomonadota bacterium]
MQENKSGSLLEWVFPALFILCAGWTIWHIPNFILDLIPPTNESLLGQITALAADKDVTPNMGGLFGGKADLIDWGALIGMPIIFVLGALNLRIAPMEFQDFRPWDRVALFVGRATMIMILSMTSVMLYEVFLRYALERPTLWANELTLWIAGFVFLCSGFYAMQQRSHIRIFILYDVVPRWMQRIFDTISTLLIVVFACGLIFGSYSQVFVTKFYRWEMFGTAFDPPIPATIQPMVLIIISLVALQAVANLFADWNREPERHTDEPDEDEIEALKKSVGAD